MSIWNFLTGLVEPVTDLIDELHTSEEERLEVKTKLFAMQSAMATKVMDYEARLIEPRPKSLPPRRKGRAGFNAIGVR